MFPHGEKLLFNSGVVSTRRKKKDRNGIYDTGKR